ncbi:MAG: hypothetical protein IH987_01990 [Planctomycetes bacterium]|nr:hypothetical protein [Planctomycetota bacterium]
MRALRTVSLFFLVALVVYSAIVLFPWSGPRRGYRALFIATIHGVYGRFGSAGLVRCEKRDIDAIDDINIYLGKRIGKRIGETPVAVSTARLGYAPLAFLVALVVATPVSWGRKWRSLAWGLVFVETFVVVRSGLLIAYWFGSPGDVRIYAPGEVSGWIIATAYELLAHAPGASFLIPTLVWVAVSWRADDVRKLLENVRFPKKSASVAD